MAKRTPPVHPENRSPKTQDQAATPREGGKPPRGEERNLKEQGRQGNIYQNTHHQGHKQDR